MTDLPSAQLEEHEYRTGQRLFLALAALVLAALFVVGVGIGRVSGADVNRVVAIAILLSWVALPYGQWLIALPLAIVLHTRGRTVAARGVLRAGAIVFLGFGLLYSTCCGVGSLFSGIVGDRDGFDEGGWGD